MNVRQTQIVMDSLVKNEEAFLASSAKGDYIPFGTKDFTPEMEDKFDSYWEMTMQRYFA